MTTENLQIPTQDRERISLSQDYELRDWSQKLNVSPIEIKDAVQQVGNLATDVARYLRMGINR